MQYRIPCHTGGIVAACDSSPRVDAVYAVVCLMPQHCPSLQQQTHSDQKQARAPDGRPVVEILERLVGEAVAGWRLAEVELLGSLPLLNETANEARCASLFVEGVYPPS